MYGLPQAGILAQELLEKRLNAAGYKQSLNTPGLWTHQWRPICFTLVVDDFGVKYVGKQHAEHLVSVIEEHYQYTTDWEGKRYLGLTFDWDYDERKVHLSMPEYIPNALKRFRHDRPKRPQNQPHVHTPPNYGAKAQYTEQEKEEPEVSGETKKFIQQVLGTFLYYARAVDSTMLVALSAIASKQARTTATTLHKVNLFLDYAATQEEAILTYHVSDMVLAVHSDASYLSEKQARSRAGGHFFYVKQHSRSTEQRSGFEHRTDHPRGHGICRRGRNRSHVHQCTRSRAHTKNAQRNGPQSAPNTDANRQHSSTRCCDQQRTTETHQSNGYAFPLVTRSFGAKTI